MVAPCINNIKHFIVQLMQTNYKFLRLLKHVVKIIKAAPTCFGSHKTIIREPHPVLNKNYISGTNVRFVNNDTHIGTRYVILAKHWMWLPDDGFM